MEKANFRLLLNPLYITTSRYTFPAYHSAAGNGHDKLDINSYAHTGMYLWYHTLPNITDTFLVFVTYAGLKKAFRKTDHYTDNY